MHIDDLTEINNPQIMMDTVAEMRRKLEEQDNRLAVIYRLAAAAHYWTNRPGTFRDAADMLGVSAARVSQLVGLAPANSVEVFKRWAKILRALKDLAKDGTIQGEEIEDQLFYMRERDLPEEGHRALYQAHILFCKTLCGDEVDDERLAEMTELVDVGYGHLAIWRGRHRNADQKGN